MTLRILTVVLLVALVAGLVWAQIRSGPDDPVVRQRGVSWVAGGEVAAGALDPLVRANVDWIVQTPFGWQQDHDKSRLDLVTDGRILWGERDAGLAATTRYARDRGIRTLLKPHLWLRNRTGGKWRTDIAMVDEAEWEAWFSNYRRFILHYAELAQDNDIPILCVGTELHATTLQRPNDWRRLIREVREVYDGELTYAANWYKEFEEISFWNELDYIGIQAYFPLSEDESPDVDALVEGWQPHLAAIERVRRRVNKPVIFTEIGYRSMPDAAIRPWEWPERQPVTERTVDPGTQAACYEAFFQVFWEKPWFAGAYFWKWFPDHESEGGREDADFTPQRKPAQDVMARWYGSDLPGDGAR